MTRISQFRRRLLLGSALLTAAAATGAWRTSSAEPADPEAALARRLARLLRDPDSAAALAVAVLPDLPPKRAMLAQALTSSMGMSATDLMALSDTALRARLSESARADFRAGRVVTADGWRISRTEAALAGLAACDRSDLPS